MGLSNTIIRQAFGAIKTALPCCDINVRFDFLPNIVPAISISLNSEEQISSAGALQDDTGSVRIAASEFGQRIPKAGDTMEIENNETKEWQTRIITGVGFKGRSILRFDYGPEFG